MSIYFPELTFQLALNKAATPGAKYGDRQSAVLNAQGLREARKCICAWPGYKPTPLVALPDLAAALNIGSIHYKQEGERFGLRSFKPLGGAYAVQRCLMRVVSKQLQLEVQPDEILARKHDDIVSHITVTAATDGNHGRSVAWGARSFGCRCVIFINEAVSKTREMAIAAYGAEVRRVAGSFDDAVTAAFDTARDKGWHVIPDTSDGEIIEAPRDVTQGYALLAAEAIDQLPDSRAPSHLFLQAGVGGMAAATCSQFWQHFGKSHPKTVLVEPKQCACWYASLVSGEPVSITGEVDSFMGGLACGQPSPLAWEILHQGAHAAMTLDDKAAEATMRLLAEGCGDDPQLVGGESGVAGLAGLITCARNEQARKKLGLDSSSSIMVVGSEGATDEAMYQKVVGKSWQEVVA